ncbi:hypothetical protein C8J47_3656 [Sphingomonas sp. PP-F2F-G114-C0414]|uniref:hypothetical protein n=1 Tax=Sphingomonas sp. PP-F2F-G114-C0414 TaxID=2135662 RepID=UPI000F14D66B|nr:hypothetical protein [Sphingomonas sp. PP-F2F-G114-C0414]RMB25708.1 hypothetical protein C8J47_3656 [Sphingomonas sp. PP-F2F-G114-C0414]
MTVIAALVLLLPSSDAPGETPREIIVVAKSRKCDLSSAGWTLRNADFRKYAVEWAAGRPIRIVVPRAARTMCLAKIMFKLHDHGVTRAEFVDMPGTPVTETTPAKAD